MYCLCVNVYFHRVSTQLQLTNISVSISIVGWRKECVECYLHFYTHHHDVIKHTDSFVSHFSHFIFSRIFFQLLFLLFRSCRCLRIDAERVHSLRHNRPSVRPNICISAYSSASLTGRIIPKIGTGKLYEQCVNRIEIWLPYRNK
jgi:hypothetical protein